MFGENSVCTPIVFHWEWPEDIKQDIKTLANPSGRLSNSDLEIAGLVILWLVAWISTYNRCHMQPVRCLTGFAALTRKGFYGYG